ncbi:MAG: hypothetical protein NT098_03400 [Candidatus Parcubacteria bacterium]|nr:hypothetical protein [Candidatus Parcubacteria bacterium]
MILGLLLAFAIFVALCFFNPHYVEYLLWCWNGGAYRALKKAGVSSFAELYGLEKNVGVAETLAVRRGKLQVKTGLIQGELLRENIFFQHVLIAPSSQISFDPEYHFSLKRKYFCEQKGEEFPFVGDYYLEYFPHLICKFMMHVRLFWHKTTNTPIRASLIIPEGFKFFELSLLDDRIRKDVVVTFGSPQMLRYYAQINNCQIISVEVHLS